jgi:hypothetical protein
MSFRILNSVERTFADPFEKLAGTAFFLTGGIA